MNITRRRWMAGCAGSALWAGLPNTTSAQSAAPTLGGLPTAWALALPNIQAQGSARFTFWGLHVYDAHLWVQPGWKAERFAAQPLILELVYARAFKGEAIAERSLREMERSPQYRPQQASVWLAQMKALFPNVKAGDRLAGWLEPNVASRFALNQQTIGEITDPSFGEFFFGIWLASHTSEPALRQALIGSAGSSGKG